MGQGGWYGRLGARWERRIEGSGVTPATTSPRVQFNVARGIAASRVDVWAAAMAMTCPPDAGCEAIVGAPESGPGSRHVHLGGLVPPYGLRSITYTEVVEMHEGSSYAVHTHGGTWEQEETWLFADLWDGTTNVTILGSHAHAYPNVPLDMMQTHVDAIVLQALDRLAEQVTGAAPA